LLAQMLLKVYQRLALKIKKFYLTWKDYTLNDKKNSIHFLRNRNLNKVDTKH
jgi:subtilase family serine protease